MSTERTRLLDRLTRPLVKRVGSILPHWRTVRRKPQTLWYVLATAHQAQITLAFVLAFMLLLAPTIVDFVTSLVFPPETSRKVFGLIKSHQTNPWKEVAYWTMMTISWVTSLTWTFFLFWLHIPKGLVRANAHAQELLTEAEREPDDTKRSIAFERALALATHSDLESEIETLMERAAVNSGGSAKAGLEDTRFDEPNTVMVRSVPERVDRSENILSVPELTDRYELREQIGSGAMGIVYGGWDKVLERQVAIKQLSMILSGDDEYVLRFRREARALARLNHPNVVQIYDLLECGNRFWMVVEYVDGGDLASYLKDKQRLPVSQAVKLIHPVAEGLALAHSQGIVHRDLKPANILLTSAETPKITDFGIAKLSQASELTRTGSVLGSPPYMSPEQCSGGTVDSRTDIYALGITLYELLTGKKPFDGDTSSVLARHIVEQPAPLTEHLESIPGELESLILSMLAKKPEERPTDMSQVAGSLSRFEDEATTSQPLQPANYTA